MPRKLLKKYMPNEEKLKQHKHLSWLGHYIHEPNLWHLNRKSVARAFFVGLFCAFLPIPMQMLVAALFAIGLKSNLPISIGLVWITNPITMPPIFYCAYRVGDFLIGDPNNTVAFEMSMEFLQNSISVIWWPLLFGSIICGLFFGTVAYFAIQGFWAWHVNRSWKKRSDKQ
ncbi:MULTISPECIES: DUF2062 domain-containing protein [unclassified Neptuniibacter]|jgi:uncharacterized protein (DUF2062 family)|uniref:DUF2062 domain-containing protein n=1 Tax=unclassified Neptuniibacter TaxID=2630693 RepID=UPI000C5BF323|nr:MULTISPECIES: DUF2062 domain-containing protein [unclassified Neptuniibacter]MAY42973.1 ATP-binding protein [Oceanospirillaceae bacterium]|tara:strand:+ start:9460 stop:9972 length:513 start_codon:yes stop_codon:yes gene_type:complete